MNGASEQRLLEVRNLKVHFPVKEGFVKAVDDVSFQIQAGETLGLVGESGCGKTTLGRAIAKLVNPTDGIICLNGRDIAALSGSQLRASRRQLQMIFQDPYSSLDPRMTAAQSIGEALEIHRLAGNAEDRRRRIEELLESVGLDATHGARYPHEFSGGQRQRIGIARALAVEPALIICDEPVSALDVSVQAQIINLLQDLQERLKLTYLLIAHDLRVVEHISRRVAIMYLGKIVELADRDEIYANPRHPYTRALLSAIPFVDAAERPERIRLPGEVPSPLNPPSGCAFHPRCSYAKDDCRKVEPPLETGRGGHSVACHVFPAP